MLVAVVARAAVETVNVALLLPAGTVTRAGTVATDVSLLVSVTVTPPDGAALLSVTVPVEEVALTTVAGFRLSAVSVGGCTTPALVSVMYPPSGSAS